MAQQRKRRHGEDYVVSLITGRMGVGLDAEGKQIQVFHPTRTNPWPTLAQVRRERAETFSEDQILVFERLRQRPVHIDQTVFAKTTAEKDALKRAKKEHNAFMRKNGYNPAERINVSAPLTIKTFKDVK